MNTDEPIKSIVGCCAGGTYRHEVCSHVKKYIEDLETKARIDELERLPYSEDYGTQKDIQNRIAQLKGKSNGDKS